MSVGLQLEHVAVGGAVAHDRTFPPGAVVVVVGPSGGERARLLLAAAGLERPESGRVLLDGEPVRPEDVGVVDEDHTLLVALSAAENVATRLLAGGPLTAEGWASIPEALAELGLPESSWHNLVEQLSGGQQQRVALARALIGEPRVLCLDDPTSELDGASAQLAWTRIDAAAQRGAVVLVGMPHLDAPAHADVVLEVGR